MTVFALRVKFQQQLFFYAKENIFKEIWIPLGENVIKWVIPDFCSQMLLLSEEPIIGRSCSQQRRQHAFTKFTFNSSSWDTFAILSPFLKAETGAGLCAAPSVWRLELGRSRRPDSLVPAKLLPAWAPLKCGQGTWEFVVEGEPGPEARFLSRCPPETTDRFHQPRTPWKVASV